MFSENRKKTVILYSTYKKGIMLSLTKKDFALLKLKLPFEKKKLSLLRVIFSLYSKSV